MKIFRKIKRIVILIIMSIAGYSTKVFGYEPMYGSPELGAQMEAQETKMKIFTIFKFVIVLIVFIIGLIMYFNKKSSKKVEKIGLALVAIAMIALMVLLAILKYS